MGSKNNKMWWVLFSVAFSVVINCGKMVNSYPMEDLVVNLPGQPKVGFKQYAGYIDVDVKSGRSLFYYFVEAETTPQLKPLTLWLNGGPGCSSMGGGAFTELGPFFPTGDGRGLRRNSMSWNKASNLLFVESPAGVGWSYSNTTSDYNAGDASSAADMLTFLLNWFKKFPEFNSRDLFLTGESYAGHYIPQLAVAVLDYNARSRASKLNLKGVAIGNPLLRLDRDVPATYEYFWSHGMISDEIGLTIMNDCDFQDYTFATPHNESDACNKAISQANIIVGEYINNYDVILDVCYPSIVEQELRLKKMVMFSYPCILPLDKTMTTLPHRLKGSNLCRAAQSSLLKRQRDCFKMSHNANCVGNRSPHSESIYIITSYPKPKNDGIGISLQIMKSFVLFSIQHCLDALKGSP